MASLHSLTSGSLMGSNQVWAELWPSYDSKRRGRGRQNLLPSLYYRFQDLVPHRRLNLRSQFLTAVGWKPCSVPCPVGLSITEEPDPEGNYMSLEADHLSSLPTTAVSSRPPVMTAMKLKNINNSNRLMLLNARSQKQLAGPTPPIGGGCPIDFQYLPKLDHLAVFYNKTFCFFKVLLCKFQYNFSKIKFA